MAKTHLENHKTKDPKASGQAFNWEGLPPRLAKKALAIKALLEAQEKAIPEVQKLEAQVALARRAKHREEAEVKLKRKPLAREGTKGISPVSPGYHPAGHEARREVLMAETLLENPKAQNPEADLQDKLAKLPPKLAKRILELRRFVQERQENAVQEEENAPPKAADKAPSGGKEASVLERLKAFLQVQGEWQRSLEEAEARIRRHGDWEGLGPLAPMVRLLLALALLFGARKDPGREAVIFLAQWELAAMLGVSARTVERWLNDPRYERYRRVARRWIAWRVWRTNGLSIGVKGAVKGGTVWRVKVKPKERPFRVLAPQLRWAWRNLGEDARRGATERGARARGLVPVSGYRLTGVTLRVVPGKIPLATLVQKPVNYYPDTPSNALPYDLYDLLQAEADLQEALARPGERVRWVQGIASQIAAALRDRESLRFWYRVLWAALRKGEAARRVLFRVVQVAKEATQDGFARKPGAYAQWLLRREWAAIG